VVPSAVFANLPGDELVARRVGELAAADLQEQAHRAAEAGDWARVRAILDELKRIGQDNPWTRDVVDELETLMDEGNREVLAKELYYGSFSSRSRLTTQNEDAAPQDSDDSYLRRKKRQGRQKPPPEAS